MPTKQWLPIPQSHIELNVAAQEGDDQSLLKHTRDTLAWRKQQPALMKGRIEFIDTPPKQLHFKRITKDQTLLCKFDLTTEYKAEVV